MRLGLFAYNFPHRKTQDFIFRILSEGHNIQAIFAADKVKLNIPPSSIRKTVRFNGLLHPSEIAKNLGIPYEVVNHDSSEIGSLVKNYGIELGVIAGARIIPGDVISFFEHGIINFHPGLIPESRGLDAILWSIFNKIPIGVTSHLIDHRVDAGKIVDIKRISIDHNDTLFDLYEKVYSLQLNMINSSIKKVKKGKVASISEVGKYNSKMPSEMEERTLELVSDYIDLFSTSKT